MSLAKRCCWLGAATVEFIASLQSTTQALIHNVSSHQISNERKIQQFLRKHFHDSVFLRDFLIKISRP